MNNEIGLDIAHGYDPYTKNSKQYGQHLLLPSHDDARRANANELV